MTGKMGKHFSGTFFRRIFFPLAIQFFFGGLSSGIVHLFISRSVSMSKRVFFSDYNWLFSYFLPMIAHHQKG